MLAVAAIPLASITFSCHLWKASQSERPRHAINRDKPCLRTSFWALVLFCLPPTSADSALENHASALCTRKGWVMLASEPTATRQRLLRQYLYFYTSNASKLSRHAEREILHSTTGQPELEELFHWRKVLRDSLFSTIHQHMRIPFVPLFSQRNPMYSPETGPMRVAWNKSMLSDWEMLFLTSLFVKIFDSRSSHEILIPYFRTFLRNLCANVICKICVARIK
jgi:hypothetical protein